jgi:hypothetical protein
VLTLPLTLALLPETLAKLCARSLCA